MCALISSHNNPNSETHLGYHLPAVVEATYSPSFVRSRQLLVHSPLVASGQSLTSSKAAQDYIPSSSVVPLLDSYINATHVSNQEVEE